MHIMTEHVLSAWLAAGFKLLSGENGVDSGWRCLLRTRDGCFRWVRMYNISPPEIIEVPMRSRTKVDLYPEDSISELVTLVRSYRLERPLREFGYNAYEYLEE